MKDRALYHLLMARFADLRAAATGPELPAIDGLRNTLRVDYSGAGYTLAWQSQGQEHRLVLPGENFVFYVRGDTGQPPKATGQRWENRVQADATLRRMAQASGVTLPASESAGSPRARWRSPLGALVAGRHEAHSLAPWVLPMLAVGVGLVGTVSAGASAGLWSALAAALLLALGLQLRDSLLGRSLGRGEALLIALGSALPAFLGVNPEYAALLAGVLVLLNIVESRAAAAQPLEWAAAGAVTAAPMLWVGPAFLPIPLLAAFLGMLICAVLPNRMTWGQAGALAAGSVLSVAAALAWGPAAALPVQTPVALTVWADCVLLGVSAVLFVMWWIVGQQFGVFPWASFLFVSVTALTMALGLAEPDSSLSLLMFSGYLTVAALRLGRALFNARTNRLIA